MIITELKCDVLSRLSIDVRGTPDLARLRALYRAWSASVSFDNVRKMIALRTAAPALPGMDPRDFFSAWLEHGTGATCWPGSNALHALLASDSFDVRRATGSMRDVGIENHGTLIVRVADVDWLVDSSMLLRQPVELRTETYRRYDEFGTEVEVVDNTHVIWYAVPPHNSGFPCRLLRRDVDGQLFLDRYAETRDRSPFNSHLYARRNTAGGTVVLRGSTRHERLADGTVVQAQLDRRQIVDALERDIGISREMISTWVACGALDATMEPYSGPAPPPLDAVPPSRRQ